ncbi:MULTISPECIES: cytochrome c oxidase assembly factor CtaG [Pontibacillus]|uniref:Cytochrome c oxidase assembly factor CtaG n=1 Tax=Pontibacillus chungwhensis TaxID=265426 RepID=A0ABY8V4R1_9BACI|nr:MULTISPECIES: cytochrome c oxidase assembly factor CtaG [Pontibacillus]MCD5322554.1 cytochrome c oxidase assembly factor CtaG [Pontibacillus sp. HN14]WIF99839.1 cytochrome c oxidase assembly factor CtaG [Pontibacillus chungwhensis]
MWLEIQIFGFRALWSPYYLMFVLALGVLYFLLTGPLRKRFGDYEKPTASEQSMFYIGLALLYAIKGSPVDLLGHIIFTAHMIQMALYYLVFPILIIKGLPSWMWEKVFSVPVLKNVLYLLSKPLIALLLFNGLFSLYHIPVVFDFTKSNATAHAVVTTVILITAFLVWLPIFAPLKELDKLSPLLKIGYIFANGVLITPACGLIIFAETALYSTYSDPSSWAQAMSLCVPPGVLDGLSLGGPEIFSPMSIREDQATGGIIMKITQEIVYGTILAIIFFSWFNKESTSIDPLPSESN